MVVIEDRPEFKVKQGRPFELPQEVFFIGLELNLGNQIEEFESTTGSDLRRDGLLEELKHVELVKGQFLRVNHE